MINLWFADIGRYNAANYALIKNVFELNLQLFQAAQLRVFSHGYVAFRRTSFLCSCVALHGPLVSRVFHSRLLYHITTHTATKRQPLSLWCVITFAK